MIKPFDYASPQPTQAPSGGRITPFAYPEAKDFSVDGVPHGPSVVAKLTQNAEDLKTKADAGPSIVDGFMALPGIKDVKAIASGAVEGYQAAKSGEIPKTFENLGTPAMDRGAKVLSDTITNAGERLANAVSTAQDQHATLLQKGVAGGEAILGAINALFTPITVPLATVSGIPGVGHLADKVSELFGAIGGGAEKVTGDTVDRLPVSDETKKTIRPLAMETAALVAQIIAGGKAGKEVAKVQDMARVADNASRIFAAMKNDIPKAPETPAATAPTGETLPSGIPKFDENNPSHLVDSAGKHDLRTAMTGLERGGYSPGQITAIMGKVIDANDTGRFTPKEISDVASEMAPINKPAVTSKAIIKENPNFNPNKVSTDVMDKAYESIKSSGGVTIDLHGDSPKDGYSYAPFKGTERAIPTEEFNANHEKYLKEFVQEHHDELSKPGNHLGSWEYNGNTYLDVSRVGEASPKTIEEAQKASQLAVYDLKNGKEIPTGQIINDKYNKLNEASQIYDQHVREVGGASNQGGIPSAPEVSGGEAGANQGRDGSASGTGNDSGNIRPKADTTGGELSSRVFARLKAEHPELDGELKYNEINLKEDAEKAVKLLEDDKQGAYRIAMGAEEAPKGQTATAVNIAMAEKALEEGNNSLYAQLIKSRSLEQTRRGQEIVAERGSTTDNSTSKYVKELLASRLDILGKKYLGDLENIVRGTSDKGKASEIIKKEVKKAQEKIKGKQLDIKAAQDLLDKLTCN